MKICLIALLLAVSAGCCALSSENAPDAPQIIPTDMKTPTGSSMFDLFMYDSEDPVGFGGSTIYSFNIVNDGPSSEATITFILPEGTTFSSASEGYAINGDEVSWTTRLGNGESYDGWVGVGVGKAGTLEAVLRVDSGDYSESVSEYTTVYG